MTTPRVVLFDLDDTLFAHRAAVARGIEAHMRVVGHPFGTMDTASAVAFWHELEERHYHAYLAGELDFEGQRRARARDFAARHGLSLDDDAAGAWFASYFEHYIDAWTLHQDTLPTLDALQAAIPGVRFGIITNGDLAFQLRKIERVGLADRMEHVIASGAVGHVKPEAEIFLHACAVFGVAPDEAAYVGDRLVTDAGGAARAGLTGVWLNRSGAQFSPADPGIRDARILEVSSLAELPALLARS
ncbi:MAG: hydrolase [Leifsonia sp.]|nr:hydrolase [Leifsonia sp.]